jgi:RNA polymerase-interacting CarD/CdnL/TRCF family regulator
MLESARGILLSELVLAKGIDESAVEVELNAALSR